MNHLYFVARFIKNTFSENLKIEILMPYCVKSYAPSYQQEKIARDVFDFTTNDHNKSPLKITMFDLNIIDRLHFIKWPISYVI